MATDRILRGDRVVLRPAEDADAPRLVELLREPAVAAWWGTNELADVMEALAVTLVIEVGGELAGLLHVHEEVEPDYANVALDIAIATRHQRQGLGPEALRLVIRDHIARGHHRFTIDPAVANDPAVRAYAAVGFKPVGILRQSDRDPAGGWRDGLLMDLLAGELVG